MTAGQGGRPKVEQLPAFAMQCGQCTTSMQILVHQLLPVHVHMLRGRHHLVRLDCHIHVCSYNAHPLP